MCTRSRQGPRLLLPPSWRSRPLYMRKLRTPGLKIVIIFMMIFIVDIIMSIIMIITLRAFYCFILFCTQSSEAYLRISWIGKGFWPDVHSPFNWSPFWIKKRPAKWRMEQHNWKVNFPNGTAAILNFTDGMSSFKIQSQLCVALGWDWSGLKGPKRWKLKEGFLPQRLP